jgi:hypothetical protein
MGNTGIQACMCIDHRQDDVGWCVLQQLSKMCDTNGW